MEVEQRQLEAEISKLRRSFQYNEKRIQGLEEKQKKQDDRLLKRKRGDDNDEAAEDEQSNKKLRSVVSTVTERSPSPERRPQLKANPQDERRNRRLLGLLQGTLSKFSEQKRMEEKDERVCRELNVPLILLVEGENGSREADRHSYRLVPSRDSAEGARENQKGER